MAKIELIDNVIFEILDILSSNGELQSRDLVNKVKRVHKSIFARLKMLIRHNLVSRTVDTDRAVYYKISHKGILVLESMRAIREYSKEIQIEMPNMW